MALRRDSGETAWKALFSPGWSTPVLWRHGDVEELVVLGSGRLTAFDLESGEERWWAGGFCGEVVGVPVIGDGLLFASSAQGERVGSEVDTELSWKIILELHDRNGDGEVQAAELQDGFRIPLRPELERGTPGADWFYPPERAANWLRQHDQDEDGSLSEDEWHAVLSPHNERLRPILQAIRPGATGDASTSHVAWQYGRGIPEVPSPLYDHGRIYLLRNGGSLTCVDAATGEALFLTERIGALGGYVASPIAAGDKILVASQEGIVTVLRAGEKVEVLAQTDFEEPILATPALAREHLYLRTESALYAIGESPAIRAR